MTQINRVSFANPVQGTQANQGNANSKSVTGLKDRATALKDDASVSSGPELSLLNDPRLMEQAGMSQIAAVMANMQASGATKLVQKLLEKSVEASVAA